MHGLRRIFEFSARHGAGVLAASIFIGLFVPPLAEIFRHVVTLTVAGLMTLVLLRVDFVLVLGWLRRPLLVVALLVWLLLCCPVLAFLITRMLGLDGPMGAGLVIVATGCAATSSPAFARLVGLDGEMAFVVSILSTLLVPFTAPPLALGLLGIDLAITVAGLMLRLGLLVGVPLVLSLLIRRAVGPARLQQGGGMIDGAVVLMVAAYGVGVMDGVLAAGLREPALVAGGIALAFIGCFALNAGTALAFSAAGRRLSLTAGLLSGNRNMALYLAVMPAATDARIILFFTLCQFPLFLSPFLLGPVYRRLRRA